MTRRILFILLLSLPFATFGQDNDRLSDIKLGTVWFKSKSANLTKVAKATLNTFIRQIQDHPTMHVQVISFNKDLCDRCGVRSLKRVKAVLTYLSKQGISYDRLLSSNRLEGELNKVDLVLTSL